MVTFFQKHGKFWKIEIKTCFLTSSFWLVIWGGFYVEVHKCEAATAVIFLNSFYSTKSVENTETCK